LQTQGSELCLAIVNPPRVRSHVSEGMQIAALCCTMMVKELTALWPAVSSTTEFTHGRSPNEAFWMEVVDELVVEVRKPE
jgi:hypothetical protein